MFYLILQLSEKLNQAYCLTAGGGLNIYCSSNSASGNNRLIFAESVGPIKLKGKSVVMTVILRTATNPSTSLRTL